MMSFLKAATILLFRLIIYLYYFLPSKSRKLDKKEKMSPCDTGMKMIVNPLPSYFCLTLSIGSPIQCVVTDLYLKLHTELGRLCFKRCFNLEKVPES